MFALVSLLGGLVSSPGLLIAARFVKGAAAAFTAPASMSLLTTTFPEGPMRNRAFSIYTVFGASGFSLGLVLSGVLTEVSWRWTLLVSAPVALAVLAAAWLIPSGERQRARRAQVRHTRRVHVTTAMLLLVYTVVSAQQAGWASARTVGSFAAVAVLLAVFATIERRSRDPLVPFAIFSSAGLRRANIGAVTLFGTYISFQFLVTQYLQTLAGWSAISTALAFLPAGSDGRGPVHPDGIAARPVRPDAADRARLHLPGPGLRGLPAGRCPPGLPGGACSPPCCWSDWRSGSVSPRSAWRPRPACPNAEQGLAASLFQTSFQVGGAVVLAIVTAVVDAGGAGQLVFGTGDAGGLPAGAGPDHRRRGDRDAGRAERPARPTGPAGELAGNLAGRGSGR